jgi:hypothetical protein
MLPSLVRSATGLAQLVLGHVEALSERVGPRTLAVSGSLGPVSPSLGAVGPLLGLLELRRQGISPLSQSMEFSRMRCLNRSQHGLERSMRRTIRLTSEHMGRCSA